MDESTPAGEPSWGAVFKNLATFGLSSAIDAEFNQPFQLERDKALATDPYGRLYLRGSPSSGLMGTGVAGTNNLLPWVLGGVAVLAVLVYLLKD